MLARMTIVSAGFSLGRRRGCRGGAAFVAELPASIRSKQKLLRILSSPEIQGEIIFGILNDVGTKYPKNTVHEYIILASRGGALCRLARRLCSFSIWLFAEKPRVLSFGKEETAPGRPRSRGQEVNQELAE